MFNLQVISALSLGGTLLFTAPAFGQDAYSSSSAGTVRYFAGIGMANIKAGEYVYSGDYKVSQLDWESKGVKTGRSAGKSISATPGR